MKNIDKITYTKTFDEQFSYDGKDLGAVCHADETVFKVWSPMAKKVELRLYADGETSCYEAKELKSGDRGVWQTKLEGDWHGFYYDYLVTFEHGEMLTGDPYARACNATGERSMVVNLAKTNPVGFEEDKAPEKQAEQIIYELHVKDFSHDPDCGVPEKFRGKFKAFTVEPAQKEYPTGLAYIQDLGVTHVQILPFYDWAYVNHAGEKLEFNWGYDPVHYNIPESSYVTELKDGSVRIRECKEMIQALHQHGLRVVMDVVYNHTFNTDTTFGRMVPGYYYRTMEDGSYSNGSACGNDIASGRAMVDNFIADSVMYWAKEYHIDGFRFDLMGLLTVELMNRIRKELDETFGKGEILLYGEPWRAGESPMEEGTHPALKSNIHLLDNGVGVFCDDTRDSIKGHVFEERQCGFVSGEHGVEDEILKMTNGWCDGDYGYQPHSCGQILQYVSAHDNLTLWDKLLISMHGRPEEGNKEEYLKPYADVTAANKLAAFIYFTSQGVPFMQAGEEFGRSKLGEENSYQSSPELNRLRWKQTVERADLVEYYKGLISLRKKLPGLYDKSEEAKQRIKNRQVCRDGVVSFTVDNHVGEEADTWKELLLVYNASAEVYSVVLPEGDWCILADGVVADCCVPVSDFSEVQAGAYSGLLLGRK
ncbi:MAG: type I pullulanase [Lachnospiraceae bacterium]